MRTKTKLKLFGVLLALASTTASQATLIYGDQDITGQPIPGLDSIAQVQSNDDVASMETVTGVSGIKQLQRSNWDGGFTHETLDDAGLQFTLSYYQIGGDLKFVQAQPTSLFDLSMWDNLWAVNKSNGSYEVYDLLADGWDGSEGISFYLYLQDVPPPTVAGISHISFYGTMGDPTNNSVPSGGKTVAMFGLSLIGLSFLKKK